MDGHVRDADIGGGPNARGAGLVLGPAILNGHSGPFHPLRQDVGLGRHPQENSRDARLEGHRQIVLDAADRQAAAGGRLGLRVASELEAHHPVPRLVGAHG